MPIRPNATRSNGRTIRNGPYRRTAALAFAGLPPACAGSCRRSTSSSSSGYTRAWQTAELLHDVTGWPAPQKLTELEATEPAADVAGALRRRTEESIALVGHEPQLSRLVSLLLSGSETTVRLEPKKGCVIAIVFDGSPDPGVGTLAWSATPKLLRGLERSA